MIKIRLITNQGLEDIAAAEFSQKAEKQDLKIITSEIQPWELGGQVLIQLENSIDQIIPIIPQLRSVYQVIHHLYHFVLSSDNPLKSLQHQLLNIELLSLQSASSFRVTSYRHGTHDFNHLKIQQAAGSALVERYQTPVSLDHPDCNLRVDLYELQCLIGMPLHSSGLDRRYHKVYQPRVTLNPTVAYGMLQFLAPNQSYNRLLDPFCGSGTILLEAANTLPHWEIYGSDYNPETIEGVQKNIIAENRSNSITVKAADARNLDQAYPAQFFNGIVTNPPYGIRMGKQMNFYHFYHRFLVGVSQVLQPEGRLVILVGKKSGEFKRVLHQFPDLQLLHLRLIKTGNFYPHLAVLEKKLPEQSR
jgi:putative N6-adenine-specific DNA methylase/tRNA (guanine6-N2)-methyltransferase